MLRQINDTNPMAIDKFNHFFSCRVKYAKIPSIQFDDTQRIYSSDNYTLETARRIFRRHKEIYMQQQHTNNNRI